MWAARPICRPVYFNSNARVCGVLCSQASEVGGEEMDTRKGKATLPRWYGQQAEGSAWKEPDIRPANKYRLTS